MSKSSLIDAFGSKKAAGEAYRQVKLLTGPASLAALGLQTAPMLLSFLFLFPLDPHVT